MFSELLKKFSGGQLTAIALALIFVPGAVGAAVTFQPVAIVDPITGRQSLVDLARRLYVFDPIAGYRNNPANFVTIRANNFANNCSTSQQFSLPAGKALVITAISGYERISASTANSAGFIVRDGINCTGEILTIHESSVSSASPAAPVAVDLGVGIVVKAGKTVSVSSLNNNGQTILHGYLVPAAAAP